MLDLDLDMDPALVMDQDQASGMGQASIVVMDLVLGTEALAMGMGQASIMGLGRASIADMDSVMDSIDKNATKLFEWKRNLLIMHLSEINSLLLKLLLINLKS